jgi:cytochrome c-type protein NapB
MRRESPQGLTVNIIEAKTMQNKNLVKNNIRTTTASTLTLLLLILFSSAPSYAAGVEDSSLGLSKTSVNDSPQPTKHHYAESFPGTGKLLPRTYSGAPPQIPHDIESFIPVTAKNNMCKQCHDNPAMIGKKTKGAPTSIPTSHYIDVRHAPGKVGKQLVGARTVCTQCHVPQAQTTPLVENNYSKNAMSKK